MPLFALFAILSGMTNPNPIESMTPERRELYMRVLNGETDFHPITLRLHFLDDHFPPHQLDLALRWLVQSDLVGKKFVQWFQHVCKSSDLEMHRLLLSIVNNSALAPVVAGRTFKI